MKTLLLFFALSASIHHCSRTQPTKLPPCIQAKIEQLKKEEPRKPAAKVIEYSYQGKRTFYFTSPCCDFFNAVYDESCNYVCAPDGGFTGRGDGKCPDFRDSAREVGVVWQDNR